MLYELPHLTSKLHSKKLFGNFGLPKNRPSDKLRLKNTSTALLSPDGKI